MRFTHAADVCGDTIDHELITHIRTIVVNFGRFPAMMNSPKLGIPLSGTFLRVNITYSIIPKE